MLLGLVISILAAPTQTDALYSGAVPREATTYEVFLSGQESFYAAVQIDGMWVAAHTTDIKPQQQIVLVPDIPLYSSEPIKTMMRHVRLQYEPAAMRRDRLERFWADQGYTFLETAVGWRAVKEEDIQLAERARELARNSRRNPVAASPARITLENVVDTPRRTSGGVWAARIVIVLAGIAAAGIIIRLSLRGNEGWMKLGP